MVTSFIGVERHFQQYVSYSVEHGDQVLLVFNDTFNNVSGTTYNMLASFIGVKATVNNISAMTYNMAVSFIGV